VFGKSVACPLHGWTIRLEDGCAEAPDVGCTRAFPVKLDNGEVFLSLPD
jgi:nitrite reductase (NADH) small subunit